MRLLLDTHAFIWWDGQSERLPARVLAACRDPANELVLSVASIMEIEIKVEAGRLQLDLPIERMVADHVTENDLRVLPVEAAHVYALRGLPRVHGDPFDRLLVAQALVEGATLVSGDGNIARYGVTVLW